MPDHPSRRHDIDWLRTIAIFLLIFYHSAISFQPWAVHIGFIQSPDYLLGLWKVMEGLNIWRIPLLFFVSGMGLYFSMGRRGFKTLLGERSMRILLPLVFGSLAIVPLHFLWLLHFQTERLFYIPNPGHLWFLLNIYIYILMLIWPLMRLRQFSEKVDPLRLEKIAANPFTLYALVSPIVLEALLVKPEFYSLFAGTGHGFWLGLVAFAGGFSLVLLGEPIWKTISRLKWVHLVFALGLFGYRSFYGSPIALVSIESIAWLIAAFGFAYHYLRFNHPSLKYLNQAVFPVYIIHMVFMFMIANFVVFWDISVWVRFLLVLFGTLILSFVFYEVVRRLRWIRPLFGIKF